MSRLLAAAVVLISACSTEGASAPIWPDTLRADLPVDGHRPDRRSADLGLADGSIGTGPPYPIVLVHGFFGFDELASLDYFYKVKPALEADGHVVAVASLDPFNSSYVRGQQLLKQVQQVLSSTGAARVNLVGHSQGGFEARLVASQIPDRIGAVVTVATPHLGARIADVLLDHAPGFSVALAKAFFAAVSRPFYGDVAKDADLKACLEFLSTDSIWDR